MANRIVAGAIAGAAGTLALNTTTYIDMLVRGRAASTLPAKVASRMADEVGIPLDFDVPEGGESKLVQHREEALGALLGYANGLAIGVAYGLLRLVLPRPPTWLSGAALGSLAMAGSDYPATRLRNYQSEEVEPDQLGCRVVPHIPTGPRRPRLRDIKGSSRRGAANRRELATATGGVHAKVSPRWWSAASYTRSTRAPSAIATATVSAIWLASASVSTTSPGLALTPYGCRLSSPRHGRFRLRRRRLP